MNKVEKFAAQILKDALAACVHEATLYQELDSTIGVLSLFGGNDLEAYCPLHGRYYVNFDKKLGIYLLIDSIEGKNKDGYTTWKHYTLEAASKDMPYQQLLQRFMDAIFNQENLKLDD